MDSTLLGPILLSLRVAFTATLLTLVLGVMLAIVFVRFDFRFKDILEVFIILPMILPPSVTGFLLLMIIGRRGPIGQFLSNNFNINLIFTWMAACIAATVVSLPLMYQSCKSAFIGVDKSYENAARTLGASELTVFRRITIPLAWTGIVSGIVLSFARALGEFGATLMVAGNIPGKTETIPTAIFFAVESSNMEKAYFLVGVVVVFSFVLIFSLNSWQKKRKLN